MVKWHFIRTRVLHVETLHFNKSRFYLELSEITRKQKGFFKSEFFLTTSRNSLLWRLLTRFCTGKMGLQMVIKEGTSVGKARSLRRDSEFSAPLVVNFKPSAKQ